MGNREKRDEEGTTGAQTYFCTVFIFAIVSAANNGFLLLHPRLRLIGISVVLVHLEGIVQILLPLLNSFLK